jgi:hypothetical protein
LAADNQASIYSELPQPMRVLLVSRGNRFLEKALRATAHVEFATASDLTDGGATFDLVVLDDIFPSVWPKGNVLAIHVANTNWFDAISTSEYPAIVDWKNTHSLLRHVNFDNVQISETLAVKTPTWAVSLVDAQQTPLVLAGELAQQRIVWIGFDTLQSTWPLRISFPIFIANAVAFLNPVAARNSQLFIRAGDPFRFSPDQNVLSAELTLPDQTKNFARGTGRSRDRFRRHTNAGDVSIASRQSRDGLLREPAGCRREQHQAKSGVAVWKIFQGGSHAIASRESGVLALDSGGCFCGAAV